MRFTVDRVLARALLALLSAVAALAVVSGLGGAGAAWATACQNELFRTGPGSNLPDCRAYEIVSPPDKNGGEVDGGNDFEGVNPAPQQAAANGEAVTYGSQTTFTDANPESSVVTGQYLSRRGSNGWSTQAITPEQDMPGGGLDDNPGTLEFSLFQGFSEDLEHAFLAAYNPPLVANAPLDYFNPYLRSDNNGSYELLSSATPPVAEPGPASSEIGFKVEYSGMSADGSHVIFAANDKLTPEAIPGRRNLYEWSAGHLELVSVSPHGEVRGGAHFGFPAQDQGGLFEDNDRVISNDGKRVFWTDAEGETPLYMRELTPTGPRTVDVSASQRAEPDPNGPQPPRYWTSSADGGKVFFTSCAKLTDDSTAGGQRYESCGDGPGLATGEGEDLYEYDVGTGSLDDLTVDPGGTASVTSVLGTGEEGSYVYFIARGVLAAGAVDETNNIYVRHDGETHFITRLGDEDYSTVFGSHKYLSDRSEMLLEDGVTRVSPNGRYLTFEASEPLTGYDNLPSEAGRCEAIPTLSPSFQDLQSREGRCVEVFEYDAGTSRLVCASCNPSGIPPVGDSILPFALHGLVDEPGWQTSTVQQRYLLDDGRLFFDSFDELLPQAANGKQNVYEYEPGGVGSCQLQAGCIGLISSGTSSDDSYFVDAATSGSDVFFITRQQLVAQDGDEANDIYDARVGGGFAAASPPPCGGEACRPPVTPAPAIYQAPPSATFVGAGNPSPPASPPTSKSKGKVKPKAKSKTKRGAGSKRKGRAQRKRRGRATRRSRHVHISSKGSRR